MVNRLSLYKTYLLYQRYLGNPNIISEREKNELIDGLVEIIYDEKKVDYFNGLMKDSTLTKESAH